MVEISSEEYQRLRRHNDFFENSPDLYYEISPAGKIMDINKTVLKVLGYKREELLGKPVISTIYTKESQKKAKALLSQWKKTSKIRGQELQIKTKTGKVIDIELNVDAVKDKQEGIIYSTSVQRIITEREKAQEDYNTVLPDKKKNIISHLSFDEDVTEHKKIEQELELKAKLLDMTTDSIFLHDLDGNFIYVNEAAYKTRGYTKDELLKMNLSDLDLVDFNEVIRPRIEKLKKKGNLVCESAHYCKDKSVLLVETNARLINDNGQKLVLSAVHDITKQKHTEASLKASGEQFKRITETSSDAIYQFDKEGTIVFMNKAGARILGYKREEIKGMSFTNLVRKERLVEVTKLVEKVLSGKKVTGEFYVKHRKGHEFPIHFSMVPLRANGEIVGFSGISRDITERKKVEEALKESEERYRSFVEHSQGITFRDSVNSNSIFLHGAIKEITGYTKKELVSKNMGWHKIIHPDDLPMMSRSMKKVVSIPNCLEKREYRIIQKDGKIRWVRDAVLNITDSEGKPQFVEGTVYDVTERKQAEERISWLASFPQLNVNPIVEITSKGDIKYINPAAEEKFPNLKKQGLKHPLIAGLQEMTSKLKRMKKSLSRIVVVDLSVYEEQINYIRERDVIRIYTVDVTERIETEVEKTSLLHSCRERVKELDCLYAIAEIVETPGITLKEIYQKTVEVIPPSWQYSDITCASIIYKNEVFQSCDSRPTKWKQSSDIKVRGKVAGRVEVFYKEETPEFDEGPFLKEETKLIDAIAEHLGRIAERKDLEEQLKQHHQHLERLVGERTAELEVTNKQLKQKINEHQKTENALRRKEESLSEAQRITNLGNWDWNIVTNELFWSDEIYHIFGLKPREFGATYEAFLASVHPEDRDFVKTSVDKALYKKKSYSIDHRIVLPDGTERIVHEQAGILYDKKDKPLRMIGTVRDVTKQKKAEEELRRNYEIQSVTNTLLSLTLEDISLDEILKQALDLILSIPWIALKKKGAIFLLDDKSGDLVMKAQDGLGVSIQKACARIPPSKCLCGRAAATQQVQYSDHLDDRHEIIYKGIHSHGHYCVPIVFLGKTLGVINTYLEEGHPRDKKEEEFLIAVSNTLAGAIKRRKAEQDLKNSLDSLTRTIDGTVEAISLTVESRDPYTAGHQERVANLAEAIAKEMNLSQDELRGIRVSGMVHDIGKIQIPAEILSKPGRLTDTEFCLIKEHPMVGYDILKKIEFPWPVARITLEHHERIDGSGYPQGLKAKDIHMQANILAVADVVEAMTSHRPYRPALGIDKALDEIQKNKGILYDLKVANVCIKLFRKLGYRIDEG